MGEIVILIRAPDAGNLPVRFGGRAVETAYGMPILRHKRGNHDTEYAEAQTTAPPLDSDCHATRARTLQADGHFSSQLSNIRPDFNAIQHSAAGKHSAIAQKHRYSAGIAPHSVRLSILPGPGHPRCFLPLVHPFEQVSMPWLSTTPAWRVFQSGLLGLHHFREALPDWHRPYCPRERRRSDQSLC